MTTPLIVHPAQAGPPWLLIAEGAVLVLLGVAAVAFPVLAGAATTTLFGWILIASGIVGIVGAFSSRPHMHFWWSLISSVLALVAGLIVAFDPLVGASVLIVVIAAWLALDGVSMLMIALDRRRAGARSWGWLMVSALGDWVLAGALLFLGPLAGLVVVGIVVGIDLILGGVAVSVFGVRQQRSAG